MAVGAGPSAGKPLHLALALAPGPHKALLRWLRMDAVGVAGATGPRTQSWLSQQGFTKAHQIVPVAKHIQLILPKAEHI